VSYTPLYKTNWGQFHQRFTRKFYESRSQMRNDSLVVNLFTLLGSTSIKAASKTLMKLTPVTDGLLPIVNKTLCPCMVYILFFYDFLYQEKS